MILAGTDGRVVCQQRGCLSPLGVRALRSIDQMSLGDTVWLRIVHIVTPSAGCIAGMIVAEDPVIYMICFYAINVEMSSI